MSIIEIAKKTWIKSQDIIVFNFKFRYRGESGMDFVVRMVSLLESLWTGTVIFYGVTTVTPISWCDYRTLRASLVARARVPRPARLRVLKRATFPKRRSALTTPQIVSFRVSAFATLGRELNQSRAPFPHSYLISADLK